MTMLREPPWGLLRCPRCGSNLERATLPVCSNQNCSYSKDGFPVTYGQPVLIDFENSIFDRATYAVGNGAVLPRDDSGAGLRTRFRRLITGSNPVSDRNCRAFVAALGQGNSTVLIIGGGPLGVGSKPIYENERITVIGIDVYASINTCLVADGHNLPFDDHTVDGVWIQAVLEHVLEPQRVVDEIHRVLRPNGVLYAETPFMQQVHEEAYDFTRFTASGHRWLLRRFREIDAGAVGGAGTALVWSIRYLARALGIGNKLATLITLPFFWVRLLDYITRRRPNLDGASGVYFLGRRADAELTPKDIVSYYRNQDFGRD